MNKSLNVSLAVAVAGLFAAGCSKSGEEAPPAAPVAAAVEGGDSVNCLGINECKAQSACNVAGGHACAGQNECKGKGWIKTSAADCTSKGGTVK